MDERANELLKKASDDYQEKFRKPLLRRDEFPQDMKFRTRKRPVGNRLASGERRSIGRPQ